MCVVRREGGEWVKTKNLLNVNTKKHIIFSVNLPKRDVCT